MTPDLIGSMRASNAPTDLPGGTSYVASTVGDGLVYRPSAMKATDWLTFDILLGGRFAAVFELSLHAGGETFKLVFSALNECSARVRLPLSATSQKEWQLGREGAWLKPMCWGAAVDPAKVDRMELRLSRHDGQPVHFAITPLRIVPEQPPKLTEPILPKGPLLDELGQSALHQWPGKTRDDRELIERLKQQDASTEQQRWPASFSRWGGWANGSKLEATGYFRTQQYEGRWWLVDPDGHLFWSAGMDCVNPHIESAYAGIEKALTWMPPVVSLRRPNSAYFLATNFYRAFGAGWKEKWDRITLSHLRQFGMNTVGNWSDWQIAKAAGFPYVRPLEFRPTSPRVFRDFPDVFHDFFASDCGLFARQLMETRDDPAFIGYFLMNEPEWGFAIQSPAEGMLINTDACGCRLELAKFLSKKYVSGDQMAIAWGMKVDFHRIMNGRWNDTFTQAAKADLDAFSTIMVEKLVRSLTDACKKVDPRHLNLGARYYTVPPTWALKGMGCFDVFSINCYDQRVRPERLEAITKIVDRPVIIGE